MLNLTNSFQKSKRYFVLELFCIQSLAILNFRHALVDVGWHFFTFESMLDKMFKKVFTFIILFFVVSAFSNNTQYEWTDENGCSYCLYGRIENGKCVHPAKESWGGYSSFFYLLKTRKIENNFFVVDYPFSPKFHVYCENEADYCKTINDSMAKKLMPSLKDRKSLCKEQSKKSKNIGLFYDMPIPREDLEFLCDFVKFNNKKSFIEVLDTGICPVRMNIGLKGGQRTLTFFFGNLRVTRNQKKFRIMSEYVFYQTFDHQNRKSRHFYSDYNYGAYKKNFFTLGECSHSNCEILNYVGEQPQDFDIKCNFIKKKDSEGNVTVLAEGVCPIEILDKDGKKQVYRVRSVKDGDSYKLIMTNKQK